MPATFEELSNQLAKLADADLTLLPDPEPSELWCPIISVDDHLLEPATLFDRLPAKYRDAAPTMVEVDGRPVWQIGDKQHHLNGADGAVGRPRREVRQRGMRFDQYRRGVWDVEARVRDMDLNGVWASLCFPSITWGFAGTALSKLPDPDVALACVRAYNDWVVEEWCGPHPDRLIPCQLPFLADPEVAAEEIRRNAARGVHAVSFSENPTGLGFPSIHSGHWDPFFGACAETGTVINLHVGSSGTVMRPSADAPDQVIVALFPVSAMSALVDWVFSKVAIRFPEIRIALSEGGASWVPTVLERLQRAYDRRDESDTWKATDPHPADLVHRNFWFTSIEDPSAFRMLDLIGEDHVMVETDYPHADSSWPNSQALFRRDLGHLPVEVIRKLCFENASALYQHPAPPQTLLDSATALEGVGSLEKAR